MADSLPEVLTGPVPVRVDLTVTSADAAFEWLPGAVRAALVWIEVVERAPPPAPIARVGAVTLGDTLTLEDDRGARIVLVARHARLRFPEASAIDVPLEPPRAELVPILRAARGTGELAARAFVLRRGDRVRLGAVLEPGLVVRADLAPVTVELLSRP